MESSGQNSKLKRALFMLALMVAGEGIFLLPFVVARVFRPTLLTVYGIDNFQLGTAMSVYGLVALAAYFLGGPLADRFQTRRLMCVALVSTALGGLYFTTVPSLNGLKVLFGFWGVSTILPFWAAMIRATRLWGGSDSQGKAFGILDGGRGLVAAVLASVSVMVFSLMLPEENWYQRLSEASPASHLPLMKALTVGFINLSKPAALVSVIWIFSGVTLSAAALVWFCCWRLGILPASLGESRFVEEMESVLDLICHNHPMMDPEQFLVGRTLGHPPHDTTFSVLMDMPAGKQPLCGGASACCS